FVARRCRRDRVEQAQELETTKDGSRRSRRRAADPDLDSHGAKQNGLGLASLVHVDQAPRADRFETGKDARAAQIGEERAVDPPGIDAELRRGFAENLLAVEKLARREGATKEGRATKDFASNALGIDVADDAPRSAIVEQLREPILESLVARK